MVYVKREMETEELYLISKTLQKSVNKFCRRLYVAYGFFFFFFCFFFFLRAGPKVATLGS